MNKPLERITPGPPDQSKWFRGEFDSPDDVVGVRLVREVLCKVQIAPGVWINDYKEPDGPQLVDRREKP